MAKTPKKLSDAQKASLSANAFKPGAKWTGNSKGRPPMPQEVKDRAAMYSLEGVDTVYDLMTTSTNEMVKFKAAELFVSLMVSKAAQKVEHDVTVVHASEFLARANAKAKEIIEGTIVAEAIDPPKPDEDAE